MDFIDIPHLDDLPALSRTIPNFTVAVGALVVLCGALFVVAFARRWSPRLWVSIAVALVVRAFAVWMSYGHTPRDVAAHFQRAGELIMAGADPMTHMPDFRWNFLPFMPLVFAAELKTGITWEFSSKIVPVLADVALVAILARLGGAEHGRKVALLYALCPLAFLVSAVHGQVEPVTLALGVGGYLAARRQRPGWAGVLVGLAIAAKTWPAVLVPGLLRELPVRRWWAALAGVVAMPLLFLLMIPFVLHDSLVEAVKVLTGYRSLVGRWGWAGVGHNFEWVGLGYQGQGIDVAQRIGTLLTAVTVIAVIALLWRRGDGIVLTAGIMLAFFAVTAGFGVQYLLWPVPFLLLLRRATGIVFVSLASAYAATFYLLYEVMPELNPVLDDLLPWTSLIVIAAGLVALPWRGPASPRPPDPAEPPRSSGPPEPPRSSGPPGSARETGPASRFRGEPTPAADPSYT